MIFFLKKSKKIILLDRTEIMEMKPKRSNWK
jgi:hypothetical protein